MTQQIDPFTLKDWLESGEAVLFDVRERAEYDAGHIPDAVLHPVSTINAEKLRDIAGGRKAVFHCMKGIRAARACALYEGASGSEGFTLKGDFPGWKDAGLPVEET